MTLIVVGHRSSAALLHRQARLGAIQRLDLRLLVDRENDGMGGWIDIEPDDVTQLVNELRVVGELELLHPMRLKAVSVPDALDAERPFGRRNHKRALIVGSRQDARTHKKQLPDDQPMSLIGT